MMLQMRLVMQASLPGMQRLFFLTLARDGYKFVSEHDRSTDGVRGEGLQRAVAIVDGPLVN